MYIILKQFIIGSDAAWVAKLDENDTIYQYGTLSEAQTKLEELESTDLSGRKYKIGQI
jgi:hypothetical protein